MSFLSKVLIIAGESAIGQEIPFGIKLSHKDLDVNNINQIEEVLSKHNPSAVLCLASVDLVNSEKNPCLAFQVNVLGLYNVAIESKKRNIPIIMISSGAIFSGPITKIFSEKDTPKPLNVYGQTKYLAELLLSQITPNHLIIRTGWIFGFNHKKSGFSKFIENIMQSENLSNMNATNDSVGSPIYISDFIESLKELIQSNSKGIFHVVNDGIASAYDIAGEVTSIIDKENLVEAIDTNTLIAPGIPLRSKSEGISSSKIKLRSWQSALKEYYSKVKSKPSE